MIFYAPTLPYLATRELYSPDFFISRNTAVWSPWEKCHHSWGSCTNPAPSIISFKSILLWWKTISCGFEEFSKAFGQAFSHSSISDPMEISIHSAFTIVRSIADPVLWGGGASGEGLGFAKSLSAWSMASVYTSSTASLRKIWWTFQQNSCAVCMTMNSWTASGR